MVVFQPEKRGSVVPRHSNEPRRHLALFVGGVGLAMLFSLPVSAQEFGGRGQSVTPGFQRQAPSVQRIPATRPPVGRPDGVPTRPPRYPGRYPGGGGWGPAAVGVGAGIIGGLILDQASRRPVIIEDFEDEEPVLRRPRRPPPVREVAPPRTRRAAPPVAPPPIRAARPAPRQPNVIVPPATERRLVNEEILFELAPSAQADAVLRRYRATQIASRRFELAGIIIIRARLEGGRSARSVLAQMAGDPRVASAQPNYLYALQQDEPKGAAQPASADVAPAPPASKPDAVEIPIIIPDLPPIPPLVSIAPKRELQPQYVVEKLHLDDLHKIARGAAIRVAVIDSGADTTHPELQGVLAGSFDALGGDVQPDAHGTAMAAAILAQAQLQGVAPGARLLAARAFSGSATAGPANGTTFHILAALDWAAGEGARVLNLSFAGPQDRLLSRSLAGAKAKGMVAVAAAGNGGAKAAPLYPGADPNVIAVTATDADDKPFSGANRGDYIAIAAPGVDVLAAEPQGRYAFSSGTSIAAAHVSGLVALLLEKRPELGLDDVRRLLSESAVDLGSRGKDPVFGAGRVDGSAALSRALPVSTARP
ncbi:Serine protease [Bosea sp. LC85]|nr:Serine protease [Bosea sp. LC85]